MDRMSCHDIALQIVLKYLYNEPTNAQLISTIILTFITLPLHVSTLLRHLQAFCSQFL